MGSHFLWGRLRLGFLELRVGYVEVEEGKRNRALAKLRLSSLPLVVSASTWNQLVRIAALSRPLRMLVTCRIERFAQVIFGGRGGWLS